MQIKVKEVKQILTNALNKLNKYKDDDNVALYDNLAEMQEWDEVLVLWGRKEKDSDDCYTGNETYIDLRYPTGTWD